MLLLILWFDNCFAHKVVHVRPNCTDCATELQDALTTCSLSGDCTVQLDEGIYTIRSEHSKSTLLQLKDAVNVAISGVSSEKTILMVDGKFGVLEVVGSKNITVTKLSVDMTRQPYSFGQAKSKTSNGSTYISVNKKEYPSPGSSAKWDWIKVAQAILEYNVTGKRPSKDGVDIYATDGHIKALWNESGFWVTTSLPIGKWFIVRHQVYSYNGFSFYGSKDILVDDVTIFTIPGMGFYVHGCTNVILKHCQVLKKTGRPMSTTADGSHLNGNRGGYLQLDSCIFEGMGDDGTNIHSEYKDIETISSNRSVITVGFDGQKQSADFFSGDIIEFYDRKTYTFIGTSTVSHTSGSSVGLKKKIPSSVKIWDLVLDRNNTIEWGLVRNTIVRNNRARGLLLKQNNLLAINNTLDHNTGPGILAYPGGCYFPEGILFHNWTITNNTFINVNYGAAKTHGDIYVAACTTKWKSGKPIKGGGTDITNLPLFGPGIHVKQNTFFQNEKQAAVYLKGTSDAKITMNVVHSIASSQDNFVLDGEINGTINNNICFFDCKNLSSCLNSPCHIVSRPLH